MRRLSVESPYLVIGLDVQIEWLGVGREPRPESISVFPGRGLIKSDALPPHIESVHFQFWLRCRPHAGKLPCIIHARDISVVNINVEGIWQHAHRLCIK